MPRGIPGSGSAAWKKRNAKKLAKHETVVVQEKPKSLVLKIHSDQLKTLMHCLRYGEAAVSKNDIDNGEAATRQNHINSFKSQLLNQLVD